MRIGYFGGSFDPPHRGHLAVARAARDRFALDRVLLAPTARQPFKPAGPVASFADRLRMTELLCAGEPRLEASAIDGPQPDGGPNYTVDTLRRLRATLTGDIRPGSHATEPVEAASAQEPPDCHSHRESASPAHTSESTHHEAPKIFAILGADAFVHFPHWRDPEELLRLAEWIIVSRPGAPPPSVDNFTLVARSHIHPLNDFVNSISATELRARLYSSNDCHGLLPASVLDYVHAKRLYRSSSSQQIA